MEAYIGQIEIFAFGFAPRNWVQCNGQLLPVNQNQALFSLLGTTYGGNGINTFALPNMQGRVAIGQGNAQGLTPRVIGQVGGEQTHALDGSENPPHSHLLNVAANAVVANNVDAPSNNVMLAATNGKDKNGKQIAVPIYIADNAPSHLMAGGAIGVTGGQPHANIQPYLAVNYCICLNGLFPSRN